MREVHRRDSEPLKEFGVEFNASLILGGQIRGEPPRLFSIYSAGNFIEATAETRISRSANRSTASPSSTACLTPQHAAQRGRQVRARLDGLDHQSNLSVGLPLDLVMIKRDHYETARHMSVESENEYFRGIRNRWSEALREAFAELPDPDWLRNPPP